MLDILRDLIAFHSITGEYEACQQGLDYIEEFLNARGMFVKRLEFNGVGSLIATTRPTKTPIMYLYGHFDIVHGPEELFTLREQDGKLYGRGILDMKGAIASYLQLVDGLRDQLANYDFGIMITTDEEVGGFNGVSKLLEAGYRPQKVCVIPDGGSNWAIETYAKGIWFGTIDMAGKATHGSRPWQGESALEKLLIVLDEIKLLFPNQGPETNTMSIGMLEAGKVVNQVPDGALAQIDVRTIDLAEHRRLQETVRAICEKHSASFSISAEGVPCANDINNPYIHGFAKIIESVTGAWRGTTTSLAGSDGRYFSAIDIPCVIFYPEGGEHHGIGEWISKAGYYQLHTIFRQYVEEFAQVKRPVEAATRSTH